MGIKIILTVLLVIMIVPAALYAEEKITLSTFYPAPYGDYDELTAIKLTIYDRMLYTPYPDDPSTWGAGEAGELVYSETEDKLYYYDSTSTWNALGGGLWEQNGTDIYYNAGNVGIGTVSPGAKLDVAGHIWQTGTGESVFVGEGAGANDDLTDNQNTFVGYQAGESNTTGYSNIALGWKALNNNTTGYGNTALGEYALCRNITGYGNTALGIHANYNNNTASYNTALGWHALHNSTTGNNNTAVGAYAIFYNTTGYNNTALGYYTLNNNTTGNTNTALGTRAGNNNVSGSNNVFLGYKAGYNEIGSDKLYIDNSDITTPLIYGDFAADALTINGTLTVTGDQTGAVDCVFDNYDDIELLRKWRRGEPLPFERGDILNRDRLLRDAIVQLTERVHELEELIISSK